MNVAIPMTDLDAQWQKLDRKFHALVGPRFGADRATRVAELVHEFEREDATNLFQTLAA